MKKLRRPLKEKTILLQAQIPEKLHKHLKKLKKNKKFLMKDIVIHALELYLY